MDWRYFERQNRHILGVDVESYCSSDVDFEKTYEWDIKIDLFDDSIKTAIVDSWNNSDKVFTYQNYFNNGQVSLSSLQMPPIIGYRMLVRLPGYEDITIADKIIAIDGEVAISATIQNPYFSFIDASSAQLCEWWKRRKTSALEGYLFIEGIEYENSFLSRKTDMSASEILRDSITLGGAKTVAVPRFDEGQIKAMETTALGLIATGSTAAAASSAPTAVGPIITGAAALVASGTVKFQSASLMRKVREFEGASVVVTSFSKDDSRRIALNLIDAVRIQGSPSNGFAEEWLASSQQMVERIIEDNTLTFILETKGNLAEFRSTTGELMLQVQAEGLPPSIKEKISFQLIGDNAFDAVISSSAEIFLSTNSTIKPVAMTSLAAQNYQMEDWFLKKVQQHIEGELLGFQIRADIQSSSITSSFQASEAAMAEKLRRFESEANAIEAGTSQSLGEFEEAVARVKLAAEANALSFDVPIGTIVWWSPPHQDSPVPTGWAIADGRTVVLSTNETVATPNLIGHGIIGGSRNENGSHVGSDTVHISGETGDTRLTVDQMPRHDHSIYYDGKGRLTQVLGGQSLDMRSRFGGERQTLTSSKGKGKAHNHTLEFSFDNRSASVVLLPLFKL